MRPTHFHAIFNAAARSGEPPAAADYLTVHLREAGKEVTVMLARHGDEIETCVRRALDANAEVLIAGGGDGTINAVASHLIGRDETLGVLPLGTLNHFAQALRIPAEPQAAAQVLLDGERTQVDVGEINGRYFLNNSSLGLYPHLVRRRERERAHFGIGKWPALLLATISVLRRYPFFDVRLDVDGTSISRRTPFVFIGNNEYKMSGLQAGQRDRLDAGILSVYVAHRTGRWGLLRLALRVLFGNVREAKDFDIFLATEVSIETRHKRLLVSMDGEVENMDSPFVYRIHPRALNVLVPKPGLD